MQRFMTQNREHPLIAVTKSHALWTTTTGSLTLGTLSLFLAYVGTLPTKLGVLASIIIAFLGVRKSRVYPFGGLFSNRAQAHLKDPVLIPLMHEMVPGLTDGKDRTEGNE